MTIETQDRAIIVLLAGSALLAVAFGIRATFGMFLPPLSAEMGWSIGALSFALAAQNLIWGLTQPVAGALADRYGAARTVIGGAVLYAGGLLLMAVGGEPVLFDLGAGLLVGCGLSGIGFPVILGVVGRHAPEKRRSLYLGIATAGGSLGQFLFAPIGQGLLDGFGWMTALLLLAVICLAASALALGIRDKTRNVSIVSTAETINAWRAALGGATRHRGFWLLCSGFFVCGFQVAFILVHLPTFTALCGLPVHVGTTGIALIGAFNVVGTVTAGYLGGIYRPKYPLAMIYFLRAVAGVIFVLTPVTETSILAFSAVMGLLWLSTVPLTSGVVAQIFGPAHVGMLFGFVFLSHQVGSFVGIWLAGTLFDVFGTYTGIWWISAALGLFAALVHLPIRDAAVTPKPLAA